jgi:hypothetical protein
VTGYLTYDANVARLDDLQRRAGRRRRSALLAQPPAHDAQPVTIRRATAADSAAIERLAALDSAPAPAGEILIAEIGEQVLGALEVASGTAIADPFRPTAELVELLRVRAAALRAASSPQRVRVRVRWAYRAA